MKHETTDDRCPGVLRPFLADDGAIVRLRRPGGRWPVSLLRQVHGLAAEYGSPVLQLTSRANVQVRGLPDPLPAAFVEQIDALGLLPSTTHERVRNIIAAPTPDLDRLVTDVDAALRDAPDLAALSGRFVFLLDDAAGHLLNAPFDLGYQLTSDGGRLWCAGQTRRCAPENAAGELVRLASVFLATRPDRSVWNITPDADAVLDGFTATDAPTAGPLTSGPGPDGTVAAVPLGLLQGTHLDALPGDADVVVTPWRSLVVRGSVDPDALAAAGLDTHPDSVWSRLTACVGAPYCRRTDTPTIDLATKAAHGADTSLERTHVVGCDRACGKPTEAHRLVVAPRGVEDILHR